jgi:hypothetical protein
MSGKGKAVTDESKLVEC